MSRNKKFAVLITILWCMAFASAMHSWILGICIGICFGIPFGLFDDEKGDDNEGTKRKSN